MELSSELIEIEPGKKRNILANCWALLARVFSNALRLRK
jgi:hypothetical protein